MDNKVTFDGAPGAGEINFGVGQPSADLLPVDIVQEASEQFFAGAVPIELNYGEVQGDVRFRESLSEFLGSAYGSPARPESLFLTGGNSQALDYVCQRFTKPGDTVFVEEPSYFLAFQIFRDHGLAIKSIPLDGAGMDMDAFERLLETGPPRLVYTIPSYHNPTGQVLAGDRRERLAALSRDHDFIIAADEVYQLLNYYETPPPALGTLTELGQVISMGSFSKILAPGLRLGWIQTSDDLMERLNSSGAVNSGGNFNHFTSHIVRHAIDNGSLTEFIAQLRLAYRARLEAMQAALMERFTGVASWRQPRGGYFFWLEMPASFDGRKMRARAMEARAGFQPGVVFSSRGELDNHLRLSFAHYDVDAIREGVARLAQALRAGD